MEYRKQLKHYNCGLSHRADPAIEVESPKTATFVPVINAGL